MNAEESRAAGVAHGKVNPYLGVGLARADGFHELVTIFQSVSLSDVLEIEVASEGTDSQAADLRGSVPHVLGARCAPVVPRVELEVTGLGAEQVPRDRSNLVVRAIEAVAAAYRRVGVPVSGLPWPERLRARLHKGIPTAGGMAGGSADAAAALRVADRLFARGVGNPTGLGESMLTKLGAELGSDVPFVLRGGTALGRGRGECLEGIDAAGPIHWVFAVAHEGLSTPAVFRELDRLRAREADEAGERGMKNSDPGAGAAAVKSALSRGDARELAASLHNGLEPAAFRLRPELGELKAKATEFGALGAVLSGSGPTMAFVCANEESAGEVALEVAKEEPVRLAVSAVGPAGGAELAPA